LESRQKLGSYCWNSSKTG